MHKQQSSIPVRYGPACGSARQIIQHHLAQSFPAIQEVAEFHLHISVQRSEDMIKADPFFGRSWVRFHVPPWVSNTITRDHLA